jgi:hypothetical protein
VVHHGIAISKLYNIYQHCKWSKIFKINCVWGWGSMNIMNIIIIYVLNFLIRNPILQTLNCDPLFFKNPSFFIGYYWNQNHCSLCILIYKILYQITKIVKLVSITHQSVASCQVFSLVHNGIMWDLCSWRFLLLIWIF